MAFSIPSRYVKNIFAQNDEDETITASQYVKKKSCQQKLFIDLINTVQLNKNMQSLNKDSCGTKLQVLKKQGKKQQQQNNICVLNNEIFQQNIESNKNLWTDNKSQDKTIESNNKNQQNQIISHLTTQQNNFQEGSNIQMNKKQQKNNIFLQLNDSFSQADNQFDFQNIIKKPEQYIKQKNKQLQSVNYVQKMQDLQIQFEQKKKYVNNNKILYQEKQQNNKQSNINKLILNFDSSSSSQNQQQIEIKDKKCQKKCVLDISDQSQDQRENHNSRQVMLPQIQIIRPINIYQLIRIEQKQYLQGAIPKGYIFRTIIKRNLQNKQTIYQMFDEETNSSIIQVKIVPEGYQFIEAFQIKDPFINYQQKQDSENTQKNNNIAILQSNFFGTQFNCFQINSKNKEKQIQFQKKNRLGTILYETNIFGLKGPRKMTIYIPNQDYLIKGKNNLEQVYNIEQKKSSSNKKILKFVNRSPKWNKQLGAFVLNFNGRVTISSVKNFIITDQFSNKADCQKINNFVLFGKVSSNVFNLDIKYPFSLIQGLALALSSFDKKLACQ